MSDVAEPVVQAGVGASDVASKWGVSVAERGFAQVPNYLLLLNQFLDEDERFSPTELLILIQLVGAWWREGEWPFPSMRTLSIRCGVSERQVQRAIKRLEDIGVIKRVKRKQKGSLIASNAYDLSPLVGLLNEIPKHFENAYPRRMDRRRGASARRPAREGAGEE